MELRGAALRTRSVQLFLLATLVSIFGSGLNHTAVIWYAFSTTGSTSVVSLLFFLGVVPSLLAPALGVFIDRWDRRYVSLGLELGSGLVVAGAARACSAPGDHLLLLYAMTLAVGAGFAVYWGAIRALLQEITPAGELLSANAYLLMMIQGGMLLAGMTVGFLYERAGLSGILYIDAATYLAAAACYLGLRRGYVDPQRWRAGAPPQEKHFLAELREGLRYSFAHRPVLAAGLTNAVLMAGVLSGNVVTVALVRQVLRADAAGFGYVEAGWAVGAILGSLATGALVRRLAPGRALVGAFAVLAAGHALIPYGPWLALAVILMGVFGACRALAGVLAQSSLMELVPPPLMGRTQSTFSTVSTALQLLLGLLLGAIGDRVALQAAFLLLAVVYALAAGLATQVVVRGEEAVVPEPVAAGLVE